MALLADRVKETTTTTGTGTVSLAGAPAGFQSFNTAFANGSLVYYVIQGGAEWEIGIGTTGTGTLARTQVLQSSNADALVPFSAGVKDVFCSYVADRAVTTVDAATLTNKTIDDYTNNVGANSTHFRIKATGTISKGSVVKATGYNPGEQAIEVAVVSSATDLVLGISEQALTTGQFGLAVVIGELFNVNTNGFTVGNIIYSNGSGGFTETKPSSGLYQALGWIVRANASNGVIAVNVVAPLYVETATNTANTSVLRDGSGNFAAGTITATLSGTATQVSNALTAGTYLTSGGTYNGGTARTFAVDATDANTASKVVARDGSGNFSAGTITAALTGNASTATALQTARNINGVSFNGTADITVTAAAGTLTGTTLASGVTASSLTSVGTLQSLTTSGNITVSASNGTVQVITPTADQPQIRMRMSGTDGILDVTRNSGTAPNLIFGTEGAEAGRFDANRNFIVDTNTLFVDAANNLVGIGDTPSTLIFTGNSTTAPRAQIVTTDNTTTLNLTTAALAIQNDSTTSDTGAALNFVSRNTGNSRVTHAAIYGLTGTRNAGWNTGSLIFATGTGSAAPSGKMTLDSSGNLGLGVTPSAWFTSLDYSAMQLRNSSLYFRTGTSELYVGNNHYYNGTNWIYVSSTDAARYDMVGGQHKWYTAPSGTAGNAITFTQAMTLDASGRLIVGATSGSDKLTVVGASGDGISYTDSTRKVLFGTSSGLGGGYVGTTTNDAFLFLTNTTERARITSAGGFSVGTTTDLGAGNIAVAAGKYLGYSASAYMTPEDNVQGARVKTPGGIVFEAGGSERARITSGGFFLVNTTTATARLSVEQSGANTSYFKNANYDWFCAVFHNADTANDNLFTEFVTEAGGTRRGSITYNRGGGVTAYNTTSDYRAKDVFGVWQDAGQTIDNFTVYRGKMKGATIERPMLIAHEAQDVAPYCVTGEKDAVDADGKPIYQQMDHSVLVPLLIAEVQSLRSRVAALESN